jgi:PAS domain S-box-containing protein
MQERAVRDRATDALAKRPRQKREEPVDVRGPTSGKFWESEEPFRLLIDAVEDYAIFMLDLDGNIVSWNQGAERIKGYAAREIIGRHFSQFYTEQDRARNWPAHVLAAARADGRFEDEGWRVRKDGTRFWANVTITAIRDRKGQLCGFGKVTRDLTARRRMDALQERQEQLTEFLAMLCHELRNPLAPITNALELIRNTPVNEQPELLSVIERQVSHLTRLVDDLLDVNRLTRGKVDLKKEIVDLRLLISHAVDACRSMVEGRSHSMDLHLGDEPSSIDADPTRVVQLAVNLITNAAKYTPEGGRISISVHREKDQAVLRVKDTGIGIPAELLPKVFDLFVQGERPLDRPEGGLGIGLTVVKRIVEMHGGSVSAFSEGPEQGSEFVVRFPVALDDRQAAPAIRTVEPARAHVRHRLLLVEDNRDFAATLAALLEIAGHEVRTVNDGTEAMPLAIHYRPDAVVMDIGIPGMNGYEVAQQFRQSPEFAKTTLIALTGYGHEAARRRAKEAGFDDHLVKPIEAAQLLQVIDRLGNGSGSRATPAEV